MPLFRTQTYTTAATTSSFNLDPSITPFNVVIGVTLTAGTASYKLQYSLDPTDGVSDASAIWFDSPDIPSGTTTSAVSGLLTPAARIRLVIASLSGGSLVLQVIQGFSVN